MHAHLPPNAHAVWTDLGGDAWEWMSWEDIDPDPGRPDRWPAEIFEPVPRVRYPEE